MCIFAGSDIELEYNKYFAQTLIHSPKVCGARRWIFHGRLPFLTPPYIYRHTKHTRIPHRWYSPALNISLGLGETFNEAWPKSELNEN